MSRKQALSVNQIFAYRLRDARKSKQWNQQQLADAMARIGHRINRVTVAKIEAGARGVGGHIHGPDADQKTRPRAVSLEEAIAFAVALDVAPTNLYLPIFRDDDVELAPEIRVDVDIAHAWARGERPLNPDDERFYRFQALDRPNRRATRKATVADLEGLDSVHTVRGKRSMTEAEFLGTEEPPVNFDEEN